MNKSSTILNAHFQTSKTEQQLSSRIKDTLQTVYTNTECSVQSLHLVRQFAAAYEAMDSQLIGGFGKLMN